MYIFVIAHPLLALFCLQVNIAEDLSYLWAHKESFYTSQQVSSLKNYNLNRKAWCRTYWSCVAKYMQFRLFSDHLGLSCFGSISCTILNLYHIVQICLDKSLTWCHTYQSWGTTPSFHHWFCIMIFWLRHRRIIDTFVRVSWEQIEAFVAIASTLFLLWTINWLIADRHK